MQPEVVFLYGPPFSGKALFYSHYFCQTHERISPHELFVADPSLSLRAVILRVVNVLNKGQSVVVDDENSSRKTRKSYLNILRNKVPQCTYRVVHFHVPASYGQFLCQWAREWELARQFECLSLNAPLKETAKDVEHLFEKQTEFEAPNEDEGFSKIDKFEVQLICDTPLKFVVAALFLQWEGLFQDDKDLHCNVQEMLVDAVKRWSHSNPCGRVIVVRLSEKQPCNADGSCKYINEMKPAINELATQAAIPVFFVHLCAFAWKFSRPPNPGLFAWLQRLHNIDLSNRATFYVYSSESHQKAASVAGVKCIKANKLLQNPQMVNAVYCGLAAQVPECVRKAKLAWFGSQARPAASVPLFHRAVRSRDPANEHDMAPYYITVTNNERVHGVCFKDFATLDSFNSRYQHVAMPTEPAPNDIFNDKDCSSEQNACTREAQPNVRSNTPSSNVRESGAATKVSPDKSPVSSNTDQQRDADAISPSLLAKHLTHKDIESLAFSVGHFRRGEGCVKLIRNVTTAVEQDGVLFTAKCSGSQGQLYDVSALLSQKGIVRAGCSCADPASKLGKCKHAVGLLLWCKDEKNMKDINKPSSPLDKTDLKRVAETVSKPKAFKEGIRDISANSNQDEVPPRSGKSKSLPKWISSLTQSTSSDGDREKRTGEEVSPAKRHHKRMKTKKIAKNTLYCLSPEELLQTAEEILEKHRCSLSEHEPHRADQSGQRVKDRQCRTKPSTSAAKQPCQENHSRESLASPLESDVLIRETLVDETRSETQTNSSAVSVIPGTLASNTTESHSKGNRLDLYNKMSLQKAGDGNSEQRTRPNLAHNKQRGKIVTASVLDDFI